MVVGSLRLRSFGYGVRSGDTVAKMQSALWHWKYVGSEKKQPTSWYNWTLPGYINFRGISVTEVYGGKRLAAS